MNKFAKKFIIASLVTLTSVANCATNKTHYQPRPAGVNLAMERTTWHSQINKKINKTKYKAAIQATGFYEESINDEAMGRYFGFNDMNKLTVGEGSEGTRGRIDRQNLIHRPVDYAYLGSDLLEADLNLKFQHRQGGVRFDYFQDLGCLLDGLYFHVNAPIVWSQTRSHLNVCNETKQKVMFGDAPADAPEKGVADYFCCGITQTGEAMQEPLKYAKICGNKSKTSLADIDLKVGYNFYQTEKHHAGVNLGITIPTSPSAKGVYLFEPMGGGNGGHLGLGGGLDIKVRPWEEGYRNIELQLVANYRYLLAASDTRTLGLKTSSGEIKNWGQYLLVGKNGELGVQPAANILTQKVKVKVGSQFDMLAGFAYRDKGLRLDLGYELFVRESEHIKNKTCFLPEPGIEGNSPYGLAGYDYDVYSQGLEQEFADENVASLQETTIAQATAGNEENDYIYNANVATEVAETPSQLSHKIYAGVGYTFDEWKTPLMLGLGGEYEFASQSKGLRQWGLWGKVGVAF